ncbi:MAG: hypothetical protein FWB73_00645 [Treponema sp.]|nr:hypothetical protein [Treponema sp.]
MKKIFILLLSFAISAEIVFAENVEEKTTENNQLKKHQFLDQYFGLSIGASGMKTGDKGIFTADTGVTYGFYLHEWFSINTGLLFHTELYTDHNLLTNNNSTVTPLCFTIPFGVHLNIPKAEWLYTGISIAVNIPIADLRSIHDQDVLKEKNVFVSLPVDFGFDFIKPGRGGTRIFFRVTPTFHKSGVTVPVGFVWQVYNWKVFSKKVDVNVEIPKVEVNVPPPPTVIIIH